MTVMLIIRRDLPRARTVNLGLILCLFMVHRKCWPYITLFLVDVFHLLLTLKGTKEFFEDIYVMANCFFELPLLTNFMFILLIIGYLVFLRFFALVFHFWLGPSIWSFIRRRCPCFRRLDMPSFQVQFPLYLFSEY